MIYYFGKEFRYSFYPLTTDESDYELLTNTNPAIYLFEDYPSEADAASGAGALQTQGAWIDTDDALGKSIAFTAITEPADLSGYSKKYYIAINTELEVGQPLPPIVKEIVVQRLRSQDSIIEVTVADVLEVEPLLANWLKDCANTIEGYINTAVRELKLSLTGCNIQFGDLSDPGLHSYAARQLAISKAYFGLSTSPSDKFYADGIRFAEAYDNQLKHVKLTFDSNRDGKSDGIRKRNSGFTSLRILK
jgi:hypothetical protein